jgi:mannose-6-phosphate isomerase
MQPLLMERVWGGRQLTELFGKTAAPSAKIGESWEVADISSGRSHVAEGPMAGLTLREVLQRHGPALLGRDGMARGWAARFGIMVKFLDASDRLSVQVHPDDVYAAAHEPGECGKIECWVVVRAEPGAWVVHGLKPGTTREQVAAGLQASHLDDLLAVRTVKAGDFLWVPAGTVHAIGPGIILAEVQQPSDVTYRLYDWNRMGLDGKPRRLHLKEALEAASFSGTVLPTGGRGKTADETGLVIDHLVDCSAFSLSRLVLDRRPWAADTRGAVAVVVVLEGTARLATAEGAMDLRPGDTVLIPADAAEYVLEQAARLTVLVAAPPGLAPQR